MTKIRCKTKFVVFPKRLAAVPSDCDFAIVVCKDTTGTNITLKGNLAGIRTDEDIEAEGEWKTDSYGTHLKVASWHPVIPTGVRGMESYLASGLIEGIGPKRARLIVEAFGENTFDVLDNTPERLYEIEGIGKKRARTIARAWAEQKGIRDVMAFLKEYNVTNALAGKIYRQYGEESVGILRENPYRMADDIRGVGFLTADQLALAMGLDRTGLPRCRSGIVYSLEQYCEKEGHVFCPQAELLTLSASMLGVPVETVGEAVENLSESKKLMVEDGNVYLPRFWHAERGAALRLRRLTKTTLKDDHDMPDLAAIGKKAGLELEQHQSEAVRLAASSSVMILTGGPGTGKTTTTKGILGMYRERKYRVILAAPTGRAAKRLAETTGMCASTIHRLLEFSPDEGFKRNEDNPLEGDALVVDECSMVDILLMNSLLKAVPEGMRLVLVGDVDQLPSVGAGNVLRDAIDSGAIPTVRLTKIFRQAESSRIVTGAHLINRGQLPDLGNAPGTDFFFIAKEKTAARPDNKEAIADTVLRVMDKLHGAYGLKYSDIQVLSPMRGPAFIGTNALNVAIQDHLNASNARHSLRYGTTEFRVGDRVMQIHNNYDKDVFNGDIGYVLALDSEDRTMTVKFDDSVVEYTGDEMSDLVLSYATTVHKSQGSECPAVIIPVSRTFAIMNQRNLLYTAVTRAKRFCVLIGERAAVADMVRNDRIQKRNSALKEKLKD